MNLNKIYRWEQALFFFGKERESEQALSMHVKNIDDDAVNLTSEKHGPNAQMNHLQKEENKKDLAEGTSVVPAKYPPKVKLEIFLQL